MSLSKSVMPGKANMPELTDTDKTMGIKGTGGQNAPRPPGETKEPVMSRPEVPPAASQESPTKTATPAQPAKKGESWLETVKTVVYALLIALVIRTFLFQPFNIPSGSMENTLLIGDYLFVEKFAYGYSRHSFPFSFAPFSGRIFGRDPQRGDVLVFKMPDPRSDHYMDDYIKRVIGLPGDTVQMIQGQLYINDRPVPKVFVNNAMETDQFGVTHPARRYRETLPNGKSYYVLDLGDGPGDNTRIYKVPPGHYFMMGDNRDDSSDSRYEMGGFGFVPAEDLVGKAELIFFSIDGSVPIWEFWDWPWAIRYNRLFTVID
jgi:signal peptidase I